MKCFSHYRRALLSCGLLLISFSSASFEFDIIVTTTQDVVAIDGQCSLHEAILTANSNSDSGPVEGECPGSGSNGYTDEIRLPAGLYTLSQSLPEITEAIKIEGSGMGQTVINANGFNRVFYVDLEAPLPESDTSFYDFTVAGARGNAAMNIVTAVEVIAVRTRWTNNEAGAIQTFSGELIVQNSIFENNQSGLDGAAIRGGFDSEITVISNTFKNNHTDESGGAISSVGTSPASQSKLFILTSTFSGNSADSNGGAINLGNVTGFVSNSTITHNFADEDETDGGDAGGIHLGPATTFGLGSNIIALNIDRTNTANSLNLRPNLDTSGEASVISTIGYNFIGDNTGVATEFPPSASINAQNGNNDIVGNPIIKFDPLVGPLKNNGGITETMLPIKNAQQTSPVIDRGVCGFNAQDQRNYITSGDDDGPARPISPRNYMRSIDHPDVAELGDAHCDIGSVELELDEELCVPISTQNNAVVLVCL